MVTVEFDSMGEAVRLALVAGELSLIHILDAEIQTAKGEGRAIEYDPTRFSWTRRMEDAARKGERLVYNCCLLYTSRCV